MFRKTLPTGAFEPNQPKPDDTPLNISDHGTMVDLPRSGNVIWLMRLTQRLFRRQADSTGVAFWFGDRFWFEFFWKILGGTRVRESDHHASQEGICAICHNAAGGGSGYGYKGQRSLAFLFCTMMG